MNYTKDDLKPIRKFYFDKPIEKLVWNDRDQHAPRKMVVTGFAPEEGKWIVPINLGDGADDYLYDHAADIPANWTPYQEPKEIPMFDCEVGKSYRVVGRIKGVEFDRIMVCKKTDFANEVVLFGKSIEDPNPIGFHWITHVYTC